MKSSGGQHLSPANLYGSGALPAHDGTRRRKHPCHGDVWGPQAPSTGPIADGSRVPSTSDDAGHIARMRCSTLITATPIWASPARGRGPRGRSCVRQTQALQALPSRPARSRVGHSRALCLRCGSDLSAVPVRGFRKQRGNVAWFDPECGHEFEDRIQTGARWLILFDRSPLQATVSADIDAREVRDLLLRHLALISHGVEQRGQTIAQKTVMTGSDG